jgi:hypothetical protein
MKEFNEKIQAKFAEMTATGKLFKSSLTGSTVWDLYLKSFTPENDPIFRDPESSSHNCNHCKNFVRRYGNIVALDENYEIITMFDVIAEGTEYENSAKMLSKTLKNAPISEVFFETYAELNSLPYESCSKSNEIFRLGMARNEKMYSKDEAEKYGVVKEGEIRTFHHMHLDVSRQFVDVSGASVEAIMASYRDAKNVFKRAMEEISLDTFQLVKDLINQGSLLDGTTHLHKIEQMIPYKQHFDSLPAKDRDNWCWSISYRLPFAKFRNELIGTLCSELSQGEELNKACQSWNKRVDPANYMKAKAPITQKQINEAKKFVEENGYEESFDRRFATMEDIKVSEILHANAGDGKVKGVSVFDSVKASTTPSRHKRSEFDKVEVVGIEKFMKDILPTCTSVEAFLTNSHSGNMVSLTTANNPDSKPIFKWPNNYSWTYDGNLAGKSQIKEAVKTAGGKVDGVLRFSIMWADGDGDNSDLDAHCILPNKTTIYYGSRIDRYTNGNLDIDIRNPGGKLAVENITFPTLSKMLDGTYTFKVHQFSARSSKGFKAEIEFNGEVYQYAFNGAVSGYVDVAKVTLKNGVFTIQNVMHPTDGFGVSKEIYGLQTNEFHKVNLVCLSPNHWDGNKVGNKHYFFMIEGCKSPVGIRSFHNENLIQELLDHRKVMEVLGSNSTIESTDKQLSGLGFNATVSDELIVKLGGSHKRVIKIKF